MQVATSHNSLAFGKSLHPKEPVSQEVITRHAVSTPDLIGTHLTAGFVNAGRRNGSGVSGPGAFAPFRNAKRTICKPAQARVQAEGKVQILPKASQQRVATNGVASGLEHVVIKGDHLPLQDVIRISSSSNCHVALSQDADEPIAAAYELVIDALSKGEAMYGINTIFGGLATEQLSQEECAALQENLIWGHKCGVGGKLPPAHVRAAMLIRANALSRGASGVRKEVIERMLASLNHGLTPVVRDLGSIGASGDLIPLAQVAGCIVGLGASYRAVNREGEEVDALSALESMGLALLQLQAKEGLALINGTSMLTGIAAHAITEAQQLLRLSLHLHAFFIQALVGSPEPFDAFIHQCKPHPGQVEVARVMRQLLEGSRGLPSIDEMMIPVAGATPRKVIQDRYSIRCLPQYLAPILDGMDQIAKQVETEANTVDDNPLVDVAHHRVLHGGNFQGQYIGTGTDALRYHIALLTKHLDVQIALLVTPEMSNGLPPSLVGDRDPGSGIKLGLKALQICGNSIMPRLLHLGARIAHLFPTHVEQYNQNINSQGFNSANLAWESVRLLRTYLSVALIFAVQSVELRAFVGEGHYDGRAYLSPACRPLYDAFYEVVGQEQASSRPFVGKNREQDFGDLVAKLEADLSSVGGKLLRSVDDA